MRVLGIDWGEAKLGIAISLGVLAEPLTVVRDNKLEKLGEIVKDNEIEKIVVGVSEGKSEQQAREFGSKLSKELNIPVEFQDETLTSQEAQKMAIEAGISRKRRKGMEDAYAATLMLQSYLDSNRMVG